jgi:protoporphyrinogen IX oxidase
MMVLWIKVVHLLAVFAWMAGLFYLPRLFVYHVGCKPASDSDATFKVMERRLLAAIMRPAGLVTLVSGFGLAVASGYSVMEGWLVLKLVAVLGMVIFHGMLERYAKLFAQGWRGRGARYFRIINEVPTVLLVWIVICAVVKPFS